MADNIIVADKTIATDEVSIGGSTVHVQRTKLGFGSDGAYTGDVSRAVPLPVDTAINTSIMQANGVQLTPKWNVVAITATSASQIAAVTSKKIRVLAMYLRNDAQTGSILFESSGGTDLTGTFELLANSIISMPFNPIGWFETVTAEGLTLTLTNSLNNVDGVIVYVEVA